MFGNMLENSFQARIDLSLNEFSPNLVEFVLGTYKWPRAEVLVLWECISLASVK